MMEVLPAWYTLGFVDGTAAGFIKMGGGEFPEPFDASVV